MGDGLVRINTSVETLGYIRIGIFDCSQGGGDYFENIGRLLERLVSRLKEAVDLHTAYMSRAKVMDIAIVDISIRKVDSRLDWTLEDSPM